MRFFASERETDGPFVVVPFVTTLIAAFVSLLPLHMPGLAVATPAFALMSIYYWTLYRPDLLPPSAVFAVGLGLDLLDGTPYIGLSPLIFLGARTLVLAARPRLVNQTFPMVWAGFLAVAAAAIGLEWLILGALHLGLLGPRPFAFQIFFSVLIFPLIGYLLAQLQRGLLARA